MLIFFVFSLIRFVYSVNFVSFSQDNARDLVVVQQMIDQGNYIVEYGPKASVWDFYLPPFYYQLHLVVSLLFPNNPLAMKWLITLVESGTSLLLFLILKKFLDEQKAFVLAVAYALSPIAIVFGTTSWNPDMIPFFSTLSLYSYIEYLENRKKWGIIVGTLAITIAIHLHYQAVVLLPFALITFVLGLKNSRRDILYWIGAWGMGLVTILPYIWGELSSNWHNTRSIIEYFTTEHTRYYDQVSKPGFVLTFLPRLTQRLLIGGKIYNVIFGRVIFLLGLSILFFKNFSKKKVFIYISLYLFTVFMMLRVYKGDKVDYYMSTLFIMPYLLLGVIWSFSKKIGFLIVMVVFAFTGLYFSQKTPSNNFYKLKHSVQFLDESLSQKSVRLLFHNDDDVNLFTYGLNQFSNIKNDNQSLVVVEICQEEGGCVWRKNNMCIVNRGFTYASLIKSQDEVEQIWVRTSGNNFMIDTFPDTLPSVGYPLYNYHGEYGNDILMKDIYSWK